MTNHIWLYKLSNSKAIGYNRCLRCGINKLYIDYVNGYCYYYDDGVKIKMLPKCKK